MLCRYSSPGQIACAVLVLSGLGAAATPEVIVAQATRRIGETTCRTCTLEVHRKVEIGDADGPGLVGPIVTAAKLAPLGYVLSYDANDAEILVFDSTGRFRRTFGRRGNGPGEYQFIRWLRADSSRLYVYDGRLRRQTVLARDLRVVRTVPLPGHLLGDAEPLGDSQGAINSFISTRDAAGMLVHVFDTSGSVQRSMAEDSAGYRSDQTANAWRPLASARSGALWVARRGWYRIERWNAQGQNDQVVVRDATWFRPHTMPPVVNARVAPEPFIEDLWEDSEGLLWTMVSVADERWTQAAGRVLEGVTTVSNKNLFYDTVIEVIDPNQGLLLASRRVDSHLTQFVASGEAISYEEGPGGAGKVVVWRLQFNRGTGR